MNAFHKKLFKFPVTLNGGTHLNEIERRKKEKKLSVNISHHPQSPLKLFLCIHSFRQFATKEVLPLTVTAVTVTLLLLRQNDNGDGFSSVALFPIPFFFFIRWKYDELAFRVWQLASEQEKEKNCLRYLEWQAIQTYEQTIKPSSLPFTNSKPLWWYRNAHNLQCSCYI